MSRDYLTTADVLGMHAVLIKRHGGAEGLFQHTVMGHQNRTFYFHLKKCEFRYSHRQEDVYQRDATHAAESA